LLDSQEQLAVASGLRDGSRRSWAALYDAYSADVWRYVARLLGSDRAAVADVVQETFIEAARSATKFDAGRGTLWTWLTGIAHHRVAAHWRQAQKATHLRSLVERRADEVRHLLDATESDGEACQQNDPAELASLVRATLAELPADYAALLMAKYIDDRDLAGLSAETGATIEAVKSKLARARREFRTKFDRLAREPTESMIE
jgi:RNA polymerase sigma-70 factor, ECF subfamily